MKVHVAAAPVAVIALVVILSFVGALAFFDYESLSMTGSSPNSQTMSSRLGPTTVTAPATSGNFNPCSTTTETYANLTWEEPGPLCDAPPYSPPEQFEIATLESPQIQAYIKDAYEYHRVYLKFSGPPGPGDHYPTSELLNVTGRQVVTGNWTTDYQMSFTGNYLLNVTVQLVAPSSYQLTHLWVYPLPDRSYSEPSFTPLQKQIIQAALSNSTVRSLMTGGPYYVRYVSPLENNTIIGPPDPTRNSTVVIPDSYFIQFNLVNGTAYVSAYVNEKFVNLDVMHSRQSFGSSECFGDGLIISDPWWVYSGEVLPNNRSCPPGA